MKLPNRLCLSLLCSVICLLLTALSPIHAQDQRPLYLLTWNNNTRLSSIWEYEVGDAQAIRIFTLQPTHQKNRDLFSAHELEAVRDYIKAYSYHLEAGWGEDYSPVQNISSIWQLDPQHLLIQTTNDLQDGLGRAADNDAGGRFGYYEFLILDLTTQQLTNIFTVDYHDAITNDWEGASIPFIQIKKVEMNPTQNQFALTITPTDRWLSIFGASVLIVDYSTLPAKVNHLPYANSPVWSPDGSRLAYWQAKYDWDNKQVINFSITLQVFDGYDSQLTSVIAYPNPDYDFAVGRIPSFDTLANQLVWLTNNQLFYTLETEWMGRPDQSTIEEIRDFVDGSKTQIYLERLIPRILFTFGRGSEPDYLFGRGYDDTAYVYSTDSSSKMLMSLPASNATYNPRNPDRVIVYPVNNSMTDEKQAILLDADLHQTPIPISKIIPADEWFFDTIAP